MRNYWTPKEEDKLLVMLAQGRTNAEIGRALGRSETAVAHKIARMGVKRGEAAPEADAVEAEDETGEGSTELEREIEFNIKMIDALTNELKASRELIEGDLTAMMERTNELSKDITDLIDESRASMNEIGMLHDRLTVMEEYLSKGRLWRLFHSFKSFREARL